MASIPLVNGGSQPVFAIDQRNGPVLSANATYQPAGTPTNFAGPALEFYGMDLGADPSTQAGVNGALQSLLQAIQLESTVAFYQVAATANATNFSVATFPVGAFGATAAASATALQATVRALGTVNGYDFSAANVTNVGFRLASSATAAA